MKIIVGMRLKSAERELFSFERRKRGDIYIYFSNWSRYSGHMSYHQSGERHMKIAERVLEETRVSLRPAADFTGFELFSHGGVLWGQFEQLRPLRAGKAHILMDGDAAGFRDDAFFDRVFLVEPGKNGLVPDPSDFGPHVWYLERAGIPWLFLDFYQQKV